MTTSAQETGYYHPAYAASFSRHGSPVLLPASRGWIIKRKIPGTEYYDAMGCYPLFCCHDWQGLQEDIAALRDDIVSLVVVNDPMADVSEAMLKGIFDHIMPYKEHFIVEADKSLEAHVTKSHLANSRRASRKVDVELCDDPLAYLDDWVRLYGVLADRHSIGGYARFTREALEMQLSVPGLVMFRASHEGQTVGLDLWYEQDGGAQGHLVAFDALGYKLAASYACKWKLINHFHEQGKWVNLGGGRTVDGSDGLSFFKRGYATATRPTWICGKILQPEIYRALAAGQGDAHGYFPAYRQGEIARTTSG